MTEITEIWAVWEGYLPSFTIRTQSGWGEDGIIRFVKISKIDNQPCDLVLCGQHAQDYYDLLERSGIHKECLNLS